MMFLTHLAGGIFSAVYFGSFFGIDSDSSQRVVAVMVAAVFAMLPDIDMVKSKLGRRLQPFSTIAAFVFRHRGFLHSFVFAALVYFAMRYLFPPAIAAAAALGYFSHLLLDSLTKDGVRPFSPLLKFRLRGPITTGSFFEQAVLAAMFALLLVKLV